MNDKPKTATEIIKDQNVIEAEFRFFARTIVDSVGQRVEIKAKITKACLDWVNALDNPGAESSQYDWDAHYIKAIEMATRELVEFDKTKGPKANIGQ